MFCVEAPRRSGSARTSVPSSEGWPSCSAKAGHHVQLGIFGALPRRRAARTGAGRRGDHVCRDLLDRYRPLVRAGIVPVLVDVEPDTFNIDVGAIESMIGPRTRAILVPNLIGNAPDWDVIRDIADRHDLRVIEDSCDALGTTLRGTPTGLRSDISVTSFALSHIITAAGTGEWSVSTTPIWPIAVCSSVAGDGVRRCSCSVPRRGVARGSSRKSTAISSTTTYSSSTRWVELRALRAVRRVRRGAAGEAPRQPGPT